MNRLLLTLALIILLSSKIDAQMPNLEELKKQQKESIEYLNKLNSEIDKTKTIINQRSGMIKTYEELIKVPGVQKAIDKSR
jgi:hypothetical protein